MNSLEHCIKFLNHKTHCKDNALVNIFKCDQKYLRMIFPHLQIIIARSNVALKLIIVRHCLFRGKRLYLHINVFIYTPRNIQRLLNSEPFSKKTNHWSNINMSISTIRHIWIQNQTDVRKVEISKQRKATTWQPITQNISIPLRMEWIWNWLPRVYASLE